MAILLTATGDCASITPNNGRFALEELGVLLDGIDSIEERPDDTEIIVLHNQNGDAVWVERQELS